jgi:hypothetical protein
MKKMHLNFIVCASPKVEEKGLVDVFLCKSNKNNVEKSIISTIPFSNLKNILGDINTNKITRDSILKIEKEKFYKIKESGLIIAE